MVLLILVGSVFGWNLSSFSSATSSATNFVNFFNMIGTTTLHSLDALTLIPDYIMGVFAPRDETLPQSYKNWTIRTHAHVLGMHQIGGWYREAYRKYFSKEYDGDNSSIVLTVTTVTEIYHYDMWRALTFDDYEAYLRATDDGTWQPIMTLRWWFFREDIKNDFRRLLGGCINQHDFSENPEDSYWVDIILKHEFNYEGE